ncbi:MAG TPA: S8 family serine peptidase, partial [Vicinamibacteria bacterium]|nr:S8 family serine peptidase [Vicinamibacteria bacterium]
TFSNHGSRWVWMAAPGEEIITTYPGDGFTAAWGTSFSTPYVAGTAALLADLNGGASQSEVAWAVAQAKELTSDLGYGRLDVYRAVKAGRSMWPWAGASAVPETCGADSVDWTVH